MKLLEENRRVNHHDFELGNHFLSMIQKAHIKEKNT